MFSSGCPTPGAHKTFGECIRSKGVQVADVEAHRFNQSMHAGIKDYVAARNEGMQPATVFKKDVAFAREMTQRTGVPYRADK